MSRFPFDTRPLTLTLSFAAAAACGATVDDEAADPEDGMFSGPKADGFCADEGTPEAAGILALVNDEATTHDELDRPISEGGAGLNRLAVDGIIAQRPFSSLAELDAVRFVGVSACGSLLSYACDEKGLCETDASCDPQSFTERPARTGYDASCEDVLLRYVLGAPGMREDALVDDATARCEALTPLQQQAFDLVAVDFGSTPAAFSDDFGEFSVEVFETQGDATVHMVHVIEENNFVPFHVLFDGDELAAIWVSDGLSAGVDWYCGGDGEPADAPEEFCMGALTDDTRCDPDQATRNESTMTVAEAREEFVSLEAGVVVVYADRHALGDDVEVKVESDNCDDVAADVTVTTGSGPQETYRVVDSTRGLGRTVLTRTDTEGTQLVCATPNG